MPEPGGAANSYSQDLTTRAKYDKDNKSVAAADAEQAAGTGTTTTTTTTTTCSSSSFWQTHGHSAATAALCVSSFSNSFLMISIFPYAGYMSMYLLSSSSSSDNIHNDNANLVVNTQNAGLYAGMLSSVFMLGRLVLAYAWGAWADLYGRVVMLQIVLTLSAVFSILFGTSQTFTAAMWCRFCLGMSNGIVSTTKTAAQEIGRNDALLERRAMGLVLGMRSWSLLASPALAGFLAEPVQQYPSWAMQLQSSWRTVYKILVTYPFLLPNLLVAIFYTYSSTNVTGGVENSVAAATTPTGRGGGDSDECQYSENANTSASPQPQEKSPVDDGVWQRPLTRQHLLLHWSFSFVTTYIDEAFPLFCLSSSLHLNEAGIGQILSGAGLLFAALQYISFATLTHHLGLYKSLLLGCCIGTLLIALLPVTRIAPMYLEKYEELVSQHKEVHTLVLPDGEGSKNMEILQRILDKALEEKLDRKCTFLALGGGVIGDMVGFAAAIYQRGVNFIQIPTTVMAMVDSSVGGKTGVNHPLGKNMIGAFHQPQCVFIDTDNLSSLPDRELQSGISEIIKYGLIRDAELFEWLEENMDKLLARDPIAMRYAVKQSCENKAAVVKADEKEAGVRATLNLGHTFGHAIESGSGYGTWLHGEAVAIGTAMAASMSARMGWIEQDLLHRTYRLLEKAKLPVDLPVDSPMDQASFLKFMAADKKVANGQLRLILLKGPLGNCVFTGDFDKDAMVETIDDFVAECQDVKV